MYWQTAVTDPEEIKVFRALDGANFYWRAVDGLARQTGLSEERVTRILEKHEELARFSDVPSISGSPIVGLIEKVGA
jgi:hypothetical protein